MSRLHLAFLRKQGRRPFRLAGFLAVVVVLAAWFGFQQVQAQRAPARLLVFHEAYLEPAEGLPYPVERVQEVVFAPTTGRLTGALASRLVASKGIKAVVLHLVTLNTVPLAARLHELTSLPGEVPLSREVLYRRDSSGPGGKVVLGGRWWLKRCLVLGTTREGTVIISYGGEMVKVEAGGAWGTKAPGTAGQGILRVYNLGSAENISQGAAF